MKKIIITMFLALSVVTTALFAENPENHTGKGHYYIIPKYLEIEGEENIHEGKLLKGRSGSGYGFDVGYSFAEHFAMEFATSYSTDKIDYNGAAYDAKYITYGIDLAYTHHITVHFGFLLKMGYGFEEERAAGLNLDLREHGLTYAGGFEYGMNSRTEFILEYEHALVDSTRGASLFLGIKVKF